MTAAMSRGEARRRRNWTAWLRGRLARTVPPGQWLPDRQPVYVQSWTYVFGVATLAALLFVFGSGLVLTLKGAAWWHTSSVGHFFNSMHLCRRSARLHESAAWVPRKAAARSRSLLDRSEGRLDRRLSACSCASSVAAARSDAVSASAAAMSGSGSAVSSAVRSTGTPAAAAAPGAPSGQNR